MIQSSIIILTYNSEKYIDRLVQSIFEFNKDGFEIIIVDNDSQDGTIKAIRKSHFASRLKIIKTGKNLGFSAGINFGAKDAKGNYLLFLNPDTEWMEGSIDDLLNVFLRNEQIGIVGGKMVNGLGAAEKSAGKFPGIITTSSNALGIDELIGVRFSPAKICRVDFLSGGFMMIRSELFRRLSGFDSNYFMYVEDMDLCFRAKKLGFATYFTPEVVLKHESHGSSSRSFAIKNIYKGLIYFQEKNGNPLSYAFTKTLLSSKAAALVLIGKILNNKYLSDTYSNVVK